MNDFVGENRGARVANAEIYRNNLLTILREQNKLLWLIKKWLLVLVLAAVAILAVLSIG